MSKAEELLSWRPCVSQSLFRELKVTDLSKSLIARV